MQSLFILCLFTSRYWVVAAQHWRFLTASQVKVKVVMSYSLPVSLGVKHLPGAQGHICITVR
jgi:hypothetical protein